MPPEDKALTSAPAGERDVWPFSIHEVFLVSQLALRKVNYLYFLELYSRTNDFVSFWLIDLYQLSEHTLSTYLFP